MDLRQAVQAMVQVADFDDLDQLMPILNLEDYASFEDEDTCAVHGIGESADYLLFRGTFSAPGWITDIDFIPEPDFRLPGKIHRGFTRAWTEFNEWFNPKFNNEKPLFIAGHSLGGALATLATYCYPAARTYTFGQPSVGDAAFAANFGGYKIERYVNGADPVPHVAPFKHVCEEIHIGRAYWYAALMAAFGATAAVRTALSEHYMEAYAEQIACRDTV